MLQLRPQKFAPFLARHPWVLAKSLITPPTPPEPGAVVEVAGPNGKFMARGVYNGQSHVRVRLYTWRESEPLDEAFWRTRLRHSIDLRQTLGYVGSDSATRLVFSEADGLSGLIVDRYGDWLVVQVAALAIHQRLELILRLLIELLPVRGIVVRTDAKIAQAEGLPVRDELAWGEPPPADMLVYEHGLQYAIDLISGQKTGLYLDQRENRRVAAGYMGGRRVLDVCCYVGGFSLAAAKLGQAAEVLGIDSSAKAVEQARRNAAANKVTVATFQTGECFETLEQLAQTQQRFDAIVLDPPRFANSRQAIDQALRAYFRLNRLAVDLLNPGGILVTCSCSGRVSREEFQQMLAGVSQKSGRDLQLLEARGPAPDHPVRLACPETDYLKCFILRAS
jgi:23S rRNA (cytosine1962-C5)-methyltransferase